MDVTSRKRLLALLGALVLCLLSGYWLCFGQSVFIGDRENQNNVSVEIGLWTSGTKIEQSFVASENNLAQIDFFVGSFHPWDVPLLECQLFEIQGTESPRNMTYDMILHNMREVRVRRINGWVVSGHMFNRCAFEQPLPDSAGKHYLFSLTPPGLQKGGSSIVMASDRDRYDDGNLFVNGEKKPNDLAFRALYQRSRLQLFHNLVARITLQKPVPFSQSWFVYLLFGIYGVALMVLSVFLLRISWRRVG